MEYMENKIWKIVNLIRGYGGNHEDVIDSLYRTLKLIDLGYDGSEPADTLYDEMLRKIKGFRVYRGNSRIFYEVFNLMKQLTHEGYFMVIDKVNEGMARTISDFAVPSELSQIMFNEITSDVKTVYIPDCEKFGYSLYEYVKENPGIQFFTSSYSIDMVELMKLLYKDTGVVFINHEYYKENFVFNKFDRIISVPAFGAVGLEGDGTFISRDSALIAAQNLLYHLTPKGKLTIVLPAKVTFGGGDSVQFREYINQNYKINSIYSLPNRVFYPYTNINTYLFNLSIGETEDIIIRKYTLDKGLILKDDNEKLMFIDEFNELNDWFIDVAFVEAFDELLDYSKSDIKKAKLNEVSSVFRGRAVSKK